MKNFFLSLKLLENKEKLTVDNTKIVIENSKLTPKQIDYAISWLDWHNCKDTTLCVSFYNKDNYSLECLNCNELIFDNNILESIEKYDEQGTNLSRKGYWYGE